MGASFYAYEKDCIAGTHHIALLAELVEQSAKEPNLD
jgi:hypothetical protein